MFNEEDWWGVIARAALGFIMGEVSLDGVVSEPDLIGAVLLEAWDTGGGGLWSTVAAEVAVDCCNTPPVSYDALSFCGSAVVVSPTISLSKISGDL